MLSLFYQHFVGESSERSITMNSELRRAFAEMRADERANRKRQREERSVGVIARLRTAFGRA